MYNQIFFTNLLRCLEQQGMSKQALAQRAGMSVSFLSDITNGKGNPSLEIMEALATAVNVPLPALLEMTDLDQASLDELAGGTAPSTLPKGYVRVSAILTEFQAYTVRQWDAANTAAIRKRRRS